MTLETKRGYLTSLRLRYKNATKSKKGIILNEFCATTNLSRKHVIRLLNKDECSQTNRPGPRKIYNEKMIKNLHRLWLAMNKMCSIRMKAALPVWIKYDKHPDLDPESAKLLSQISSSTIDRLLKPYKKSKGLSATEPSAFIKSRIPIELLEGKVKTPGFIEADTVAHCGNCLAGTFANTLTMTDLYCGWTENAASLTKTATSIIDGIKSVRQRLPFKLKGFACDNGTEFINNDLLRYLENHHYGYVKLVRRRPYKKNDNAHVEQKNNTHVRQLFGYPRIDHQDLVDMMNEIYRNYWNPLLNHFCPVMKLKKKIRIGSKIKKIYDTPASPYQRLVESETLTEVQLEKLKLNHSLMNPFELEAGLKLKLELFNRIMRNYKNIISEEEISNAS